MLVRYFMTSNLITLSPDQKCLEALHLFREHGIRRAPVLDEDQIVGIVSERDLYRVIPGTFLQTSPETTEASKKIAIKNIMTTDVHVISQNDHLETAARLMLNQKIGGIPVVDEGRIEGIITESDIFKALWNILANETNYRILFSDKDDDTNTLPNTYLNLCIKHHCLVHTYVSHPGPDGGYIHYPCIQGAGVDKLIDELWAKDVNVLMVEEGDNTMIRDNP